MKPPVIDVRKAVTLKIRVVGVRRLRWGIRVLAAAVGIIVLLFGIDVKVDSSRSGE